MTLTVINWDISNCILDGIYSDTSPALAGASIELPPLDYVVGDILSLHFYTQPNGKMYPEKDAAWHQIVRNTWGYRDITACAVDTENTAPYSGDLFSLLNFFFSASNEQMTFYNFEWLLAVSKTPEPYPIKNVVPKGFWTSAGETKDGVIARDEVYEALNGSCSVPFFQKLDDAKEHLDLHCRFEIQGFADLALVCAHLTLKSGRILRRCAHCGRLFSPSRAGEIYCNRLAPGGKTQTCKEASKYEKQLKRERASESGKIYKSVNTMLAAKIDYAKTPEDAEYRREELFVFRDAAKEWRERIKLGTATETEYIKFLNSFKKRKSK